MPDNFEIKPPRFGKMVIGPPPPGDMKTVTPPTAQGQRDLLAFDERTGVNRQATPAEIARHDQRKAAAEQRAKDEEAAAEEAHRHLRTDEGRADAQRRYEAAEVEMRSATAEYEPARQRWAEATAALNEARTAVLHSQMPIPTRWRDRDPELEAARSAAAWDKRHPPESRSWRPRSASRK